MAIYQLRSFGPDGRIAAVQRLSALDDAEALSIARDMVKGAAIAGFELWAGSRRVHAGARKEKPRRSGAEGS